MTYPPDDDYEKQREEHDTTWHGLDEAELRASIRRILSGIRDNELDSHPRLIREMARVRQVVLEELAAAAKRDLNFEIEYHDKSSREACAKLAEQVNGHLAQLGLALSWPASDQPAWLGVAMTRPSESGSWLQLEPIEPAPGRSPHRLPSGLPQKLDVVPAPDRRPAIHTPRGRSDRSR